MNEIAFPFRRLTEIVSTILKGNRFFINMTNYPPTRPTTYISLTPRVDLGSLGNP